MENYINYLFYFLITDYGVFVLIELQEKEHQDSLVHFLFTKIYFQ